MLYQFMVSLVEIDPVVLEKKSKMCKVYRQMDICLSAGRQADGQTNGHWTSGYQRSSGKLKTDDCIA